MAPKGAARTLHVELEQVELKAPVRISGFVFSGATVVVVTLREGEAVGRGEAAGVYYRRETPAGIAQAIEAVRADIEAGLDRAALQVLLPAGGARNALDCALWDLEAKRSGRAVHELLGLPAPKPLLTTYTLGADEPDNMARQARELAEARAFKLKLIGDDLDA